MEKLDFQSIKAIIQECKLDLLLDQSENMFFDCKREPYRLGSDIAKRELAKDISSFANSRGGFIFIGPRTKKSEFHPNDVVSEIRGIQKSIVDIKQYNDTIKAWIYPQIENINIAWIECADDPDKGILKIEIPDQSNSLKPFLITKYLDEGKKTEILVGFAERKGDASEPNDVRFIYSLMRDGLNYQNTVESRFDRIDDLLDSFVELKLKEEQNSYTEEISNRFEKIIEVNEMNTRRALILAAYPQKPNAIKSIFDKRDNSILRALEDPPILRNSGWDLRTLDRARIGEGKYIQVCNGKRKTIRLYKDGTLLFAADQNFWTRPDDEGLKLNCLAIVEAIYNFIHFYRRLIKDFRTPQNTINLKWGCHNFRQNSKPTHLSPGALGTHSWNDPYPAPEDHYVSEEYQYDFQNLDEKIAYNLIEEIYLWFGIGLDDWTIPYTKVEDDVKMIDTNKIIGTR